MLAKIFFWDAAADKTDSGDYRGSWGSSGIQANQEMLLLLFHFVEVIKLNGLIDD